MTENEFVSILNRNKQRIYLIALSFTRSQADAEDVMQNTFLKLWKHPKPFADDEHIDKWLTKVAVNESRSLLVSPFRKRSEPLEILADEQFFDKPQDMDLFRAVMQLPDRLGEVVHLFYYEDQSLRQIAGLLGISDATAKTRLYRARTILRETLGEGWYYEQ